METHWIIIIRFSVAIGGDWNGLKSKAHLLNGLLRSMETSWLSADTEILLWTRKTVLLPLSCEKTPNMCVLT